MTPILITAMTVLLAADKPASSPKALEQLQALHVDEASKWHMIVGNDREAELVRKPIYNWTNPIRSGGQHGGVYLWIYEGRPVVIGSIFSHPEAGQRIICHEFHSMTTLPLKPDRDSAEQRWDPQAGVELKPLAGAPAPENSAARRLIQMRTLGREFTAHSIDNEKERWELRLLSQPMYRYEKPQGDVIDGALFAFVTSAGTDPEVVLAIEARRTPQGNAWYYRALRFSDSNLYVQNHEKEVWSSVRDERNQLFFNPDHTYRLLRDKSIAELPELAPGKN